MGWKKTQKKTRQNAAKNYLLKNKIGVEKNWHFQKSKVAAPNLFQIWSNQNILTSDKTFWLNTLILVFIATSKYGTPIWPQTRDEYPINRAKIHNHGNILFHGQISTREVFALCDLLRQRLVSLHNVRCVEKKE